jgi:WhiB family transcriptional regulator, redox-sensing transcriptional regulator
MTASQRRRATPLYPPSAVLLPPAEDARSWENLARCAEVDPEIFFPEKGGTTREAKKVCRACEVRAECLDYALTNDERFGVFGGLSERERRKLKLQPAQNVSTETKHCPGCDETKSVDEFHCHTGKPDGRRTYCKECSRPEKARLRAHPSPAAVAGRRRVTVSQMAEIQARHEAGETFLKIGDDLGFSDSYLSRLLSGALMPAPDPVPDDAGAASTAADLVASQHQPGRVLAGSRQPVPDQNQEEAA